MVGVLVKYLGQLFFILQILQKNKSFQARLPRIRVDISVFKMEKLQSTLTPFDISLWIQSIDGELFKSF